MRDFSTLPKWLRRKQISSILLVVFSFLLVQSARFLPPNPQWQIRWLPWWLLLIAAVLTVIVIEKFAPQRVSPRLGAPLLLHPGEESPAGARKGLIALVSKYRAQGKQPDPEVVRTAIKQCDYNLLDIEHSNLGPVIQAVMAHSSRLKYCWLIGSAGTPSKDPDRQAEAIGSADFTPLFVKYLREKRGMTQCTFRYGARYAVPLSEDSQVYRKTHDLVNEIFRESERSHLTSGDMVVDFTGGVRGMSTGAVLACLDGERDVEFLGVHYDDNGDTIPGTSFLVIVPFEADVPRE